MPVEIKTGLLVLQICFNNNSFVKSTEEILKQGILIF